MSRFGRSFPIRGISVSRQQTSGAISGSLSVTLDAATLSATGNLPIVGTLSTTLDSATLAAAGSLPVSGALSTTLDDATLSATGNLPIAGSLSTTLDAATLSATGILTGGDTVVTPPAATGPFRTVQHFHTRAGYVDGARIGVLAGLRSGAPSGGALATANGLFEIQNIETGIIPGIASAKKNWEDDEMMIILLEAA